MNRPCLAAIFSIFAFFTSPASAAEDFYGDPLPKGAVARLGTVRFVPDEGAWTVAAAPDGKQIASASAPDGDTKAVEIWDAATGKRTARFLEGSEHISSIQWSHDGQTMVISRGPIVEIWSVTGEPRKKLELKIPVSPNEDDESNLWPVCCSQDDKWVAALSRMEKTLYICDAVTGQIQTEIALHRLNYSAQALAITNDSRTVAVGGRGGIELYDISSGERLAPILLDSPADQAQWLEVSPDGLMLAVAINRVGTYGDEQKSSIQLFDLKTRQSAVEWTAPTSRIASLTFADQGQAIVAAANYGSLICFDRKHNDIRWQTRRVLNSQTYATVMPDGKTIVASGKCITMWDVATGKQITPQAGHFEAVNRTAIDIQRGIVVTAAHNGVWRWKLASSEPLGRMGVQGRLISSSEDLSLLAVAYQNRLEIVDQSSSEVLHSFRIGIELPNDVLVANATINQQSQQVAIHLYYDRDDEEEEYEDDNEDGAGEVYVFSLTDGKLVSRWGGLHWWPGIAFSREGNLFAWSPPSIQIRDIKQDKTFRLSDDPDEWNSQGFVFLPNGEHLVTSETRETTDRDPFGNSEEKRTTVLTRWDWRTRKQIWETTEITVDTDKITCSPDGRLIACSTSESGFPIYVLSAKTGKQVAKYTGHRGMIESLTFSADNRYLVSGSDDTTALVWDLKDVVVER